MNPILNMYSWNMLLAKIDCVKYQNMLIEIIKTEVFRKLFSLLMKTLTKFQLLNDKI